MQNENGEYACVDCDKTYKIKGSLYSHNRTKHNDANKAETVEKDDVDDMPNEDDFDVEYHDDMEKLEAEVELELQTKSWVENEVARQERAGPTVSTMELNSFLLPRPDSRLNSFLELEEGLTLQEMWQEGEFNSEFGEALRRQSLQLEGCDNCVRTKETVNTKEKEIEHMNEVIKGANKTLLAAEKTKKYLREVVKKKDVQIEEVTLSWQADVESSNTEITKLKTQLQIQKDMVLALKTEREADKKEENEPKEGEVQRKRVEVTVEDEEEDDVEVLKEKRLKCTLCSFATNNTKQLKRHKWRSHSVWDCSMCPHTSTKTEDREQHLKVHREELDRILHRCDCCQKTFKTKEELIKHKKTDCKCQECKEKYSQECKCLQCKVKCSQASGPKEQEVKEAQEVKEVQEERQEEPCRNGPACTFLKQNRCKFIHPQQPRQQPQQPRQQPQQPRLQPQQPRQQHQHPRQQPQHHRQQPQQPRLQAQPLRQQPQQPRQQPQQPRMQAQHPRQQPQQPHPHQLPYPRQQHHQPHPHPHQQPRQQAQGRRGNVHSSPVQECREGVWCTRGRTCMFAHPGWEQRMQEQVAGWRVSPCREGFTQRPLNTRM